MCRVLLYPYFDSNFIVGLIKLLAYEVLLVLAFPTFQQRGVGGGTTTWCWMIEFILYDLHFQVLPRLTTPTADELGYCDVISVEEVGDTRVVVFRMESSESRISTVLIRGATDNYMDDIERAIDDGVNTFKGIARDGR